MKSLAEFEKFLTTDQELNSDLSNLETQRKNTKNYSFIILILAVIFVIAIGTISYNKINPQASGEEPTNNVLMLIGIFIGGAFALSYLYYFFMKNKLKQNPTMFGSSANGFEFDFKDKVIRKIINFWDPGFKYQINNHIKIAEIYESGMLYQGNNKVTGSDMIQGEIDGISFKFSDIQVLREKKFVGKNESPYESVVTGSFFSAAFNKEFKNPVYVYPNKSMWTEMDGLKHEGDKVSLEDPEFMKAFDVYASDQIEARYILTPSMMSRIMKMREKMGKALHISFANNSIYIMNNNGKDRFEASWFKSLNKKDNLIAFYEELDEQLSIINELNLNINIWKN